MNLSALSSKFGVFCWLHCHLPMKLALFFEFATYRILSEIAIPRKCKLSDFVQSISEISSNSEVVNFDVLTLYTIIFGLSWHDIYR